MAIKPKVTTMDASGAQILNAIRNDSSDYYKSLVPRADGTIQNLRQIGDIVTAYHPLRNEFLHNMVNMIARVIITNKSYSNPWARFKKGIMEFGETIAEYFVNPAAPHGYNPAVAETNWMKREKPDVRAAFHTVNYKAFYKQTIQEADLTAAFYNWEGIDQLIAKIVDAMYTGDAYDEFNAMKYLIAKAALNGYLTPAAFTNANDYKEIGADFKSISNQLTFLSPNYNAMGVLNYTDKRNQILIMNSDFDAQFDTNFLAGAFNLQYAEFLGQRVLVDSFGNIDQKRLSEIVVDGETGEPAFIPLTDAQLAAAANIPAVLVDSDWFMIFDNKIRFEENFNGEGIYWQYWYHVWKTMSFSPFANALIFGSEVGTVTGVDVYPTAVTINAGDYAQMSATVKGSPYVNSQVTWSSSNPKITVSATGLVHAEADATGSATITATSVADTTKSGTATVTIA